MIFVKTFLAFKIGNQLHTIKFTERKIPQYIFAQKKSYAVRYMFWAIFALYYVGKILQKYLIEVNQ